MTDVSATEYDELSYEGGGLPKTGNWWSAFVIGLAGTILVTGIAPTMVTSLGAAAIPITFLVTLSGWLLCLFLAELAAMMPDRSGGSPTYAYVAFKDRWPTFAGHVNGITAWGYWLGWFPVAPLNMILASFYIAEPVQAEHHRAGSRCSARTIAWWTIGISVVGILLLFIPSYRGLRFGTFFATDARAAVDDPADVPGDLLDLQPLGRRLQPADPLPAHERHRLLHPDCTATAG